MAELPQVAQPLPLLEEQRAERLRRALWPEARADAVAAALFPGAAVLRRQAWKS